MAEEPTSLTARPPVPPLSDRTVGFFVPTARVREEHRGNQPQVQPTKGAATRQRIVELAAPVFNRRGYVGASMRDLVDATGLEKGGIYNHFGSKEQLALEAYDHAMSHRHRLRCSGRRSAEHDAIQRLQSMIRAFATFGPHARRSRAAARS